VELPSRLSRKPYLCVLRRCSRRTAHALDVSTQPHEAAPQAWISGADEEQEWTEGTCTAPSQRAAQAHGERRATVSGTAPTQGAEGNSGAVDNGVAGCPSHAVARCTGCRCWSAARQCGICGERPAAASQEGCRPEPDSAAAAGSAPSAPSPIRPPAPASGGCVGLAGECTGASRPHSTARRAAGGARGSATSGLGLMRALLIGVIRLYRLLVSPLLPGACRFYPSCSEYAEQALRRYGVLKGGALALRRLLRCHPWHPGGIDPVP